LGVDLGEHVHAHLLIQIEVVAAGMRGRGLVLGLGLGGRCGGAAGGAGALAADAVAEQAHDGDIDREPEEPGERGGDRLRHGRGGAFGRRGAAARGRWGDRGIPAGGLVRHVHSAFYTSASGMARIILTVRTIFFACARGWVALAG
jgi:hypothetical protein